MVSGQRPCNINKCAIRTDRTASKAMAKNYYIFTACVQRATSNVMTIYFLEFYFIHERYYSTAILNVSLYLNCLTLNQAWL